MYRERGDTIALAARETVNLVVSLVILAALIPVGITALNDADTTNWTTAQIALFSILGVIVLAGVLVLFVRGSGKGA